MLPWDSLNQTGPHMLNIMHIEFRCILELLWKYMQTLYLYIYLLEYSWYANDIQVSGPKKSSLNSSYSTN